MKKCVAVCAVVLCLSTAAWADGSWETYVIRNANSDNSSPTITVNGDESVTFDVSSAGQKAGWGTDAANGLTLGDIVSFSIDVTKYSDGASEYAPYINIWITDGTSYAILTVDPSELDYHDATWEILEDATVYLYSIDSEKGFTLPDGTVIKSNIAVGSSTTLTWSDFADYEIASSGDEDMPYGFNWVFGDSASNYVGVYTASNPTLVTVPLPGAVLLGMLGLGTAGMRLRRRKAA